MRTSNLLASFHQSVGAGSDARERREIKLDELELVIRHRSCRQWRCRGSRLDQIAGGANDMRTTRDQNASGFRSDASRHASHEHPAAA